MEALDIARRMADLNQTEEACRAYTLALHSGSLTPEEEMEGAIYILQSGGSYKVAYTAFLSLYNRGLFQEDCLSIITEAFYRPNAKLLKAKYERTCKALKKYPYLFRKDFPAFEDLPVLFYPFDDDSYIPFDRKRAGSGTIGSPAARSSAGTSFKIWKIPSWPRMFIPSMSWNTYMTTCAPVSGWGGKTTSTCTIPTGRPSAHASSA